METVVKETAETSARAAQSSLMETLEKAAQRQGQANNPSAENGQSASQETEVKVDPKAETAKVDQKTDESKDVKVETPKEKKAAKPAKKFWEAPKGEEKKSEEVVDWGVKYKELENQYSSLKAEREQSSSTPEAKLAKKIAEHGGIDKLIGKIQAVNPTNKTNDQLLKDRVVRSLEEMLGKEAVTQDIIEEQLEKVKDKDIITQKQLADDERRLQLEVFNKEMDEFKPEQSLKAEKFASDLTATHNSTLGKEILGLPVTEYRHKQMEAEIEAYSKGTKELTGSDLYEYLYFKAHQGEIFENVWNMDRTEKLEEEISKLQGQDVKVGNTRMTDMGTVLSKKEEDLRGLLDAVGQTSRAMEQKVAERNSKK
jgi:hypothetical protein